MENSSGYTIGVQNVVLLHNEWLKKYFTICKIENSLSNMLIGTTIRRIRLQLGMPNFFLLVISFLYFLMY